MRIQLSPVSLKSLDLHLWDRSENTEPRKPILQLWMVSLKVVLGLLGSLECGLSGTSQRLKNLLKIQDDLSINLHLFSDDEDSSIFSNYTQAYIPTSPSYCTPILTSPNTSDDELSLDVPTNITVAGLQPTNHPFTTNKYLDTFFSDFIPEETDRSLQADCFLQNPEVCAGHELSNYLSSFMNWYACGVFLPMRALVLLFTAGVFLKVFLVWMMSII